MDTKMIPDEPPPQPQPWGGGVDRWVLTPLSCDIFWMEFGSLDLP